MEVNFRLLLSSFVEHASSFRGTLWQQKDSLNRPSKVYTQKWILSPTECQKTLGTSTEHAALITRCNRARLRRGDDNQTCAQGEEGRGSTKRPALTDLSKQHCWPQSWKERRHMWCLFYCLRLVNFQNLSTINLMVTMVFSNEFEMISQWQTRMLFPV